MHRGALTHCQGVCVGVRGDWDCRSENQSGSKIQELQKKSVFFDPVILLLGICPKDIFQMIDTEIM